MKPRHRPPLGEHSADELAHIEALDRELSRLANHWCSHGSNYEPGSLKRISELTRQLDALRPEWRGLQYVTPIEERQRQAADNIFNS